MTDRTDDHGPPAREAFGVLAPTVIALAVLLSAVAVVPNPSGTGTCARPWQTDPATATPVKHLFILVKENHAFENYFGDLPGVLGYPPNGSFPTTLGGTGRVSPFPLSGGSSSDLPHDAASDLADYNGGANNLFVAEAAAHGVANPSDAVGYYTARQIPDYYAYATNYTLGDRFFTGVLGPTFPNRVFDISSYVGSWNADTPPPPDVASAPTVLGQLTGARVPWYYDYSGFPYVLTPLFFPALSSDPCAVARITSAGGLASQLASAAPPSVVYLDPVNSLTYSEHPSANVTVGENWTVAAVNTIFESPIASSSAVLIFFDENGGFWDPVPPPDTSTGRDGFRVPFLVLSPWTPAGKVCSAPIDPAAVLRFIDENWNLPYLTPRVASAGNLSCYFDFSGTPRAPLILPTNVTSAELGDAGPVPAPAGPGSIPPVGETPTRAATWVPEPFSSPVASAARREAEGS